MNNFQELQVKNMADFASSKERIKTRFDKTRALYLLIGNIVELYFPAVIDTFDDFFGGDRQNDDDDDKKDEA